MRIQPWITAVTCSAMLLAARTPCSGQTPFADGASNYGMQNPAYQGYPGEYGAPPGGYYPTPYAAGGPADPNTLYPPGTPESFQPWPEISPFNPANVSQTQLANQDGLWFKQMLYRRRDYSATVSAAAIQFRNAGEALIGSPYQRRGNFGGPGFPLGVPANQTYAGSPLLDNFLPSVAGFYILNDTVFPYPLLATATTELVNQTTDSLYPIYEASIMGSPKMAPGLQGELAYYNEDDTGIKLTGWGAGQVGASFSRGQDEINGIPLNQTLVNFIGGGLITPLNGNIPLDNGEPLPGAPDFGDGSTAKYDLLYSVKTTTNAGGANMSFYQQPLYKNDGVMLHTLWGARYLYINEAFAFKGVDSGFNYTLPVSSTTSTGGTGTGTGTTGSTGGGGIHPTTTSLVALYDQYTATLNNKVQSNLAGPEIGLRFDLGDSRKGFNVWGESILGLAVNNEQINLNGNQIGDPLADVRVRGYTTPRILSNDSRFNSSVNSTHISPTFQQSVFADFDFIDVIPGLRELSVLDNSTFRLGYTVLWVGAVSRPADTINWQGYPLFPQIDRHYNSWWAQQLTMSLNFNF